MQFVQFVLSCVVLFCFVLCCVVLFCTRLLEKLVDRLLFLAHDVMVVVLASVQDDHFGARVHCREQHRDLRYKDTKIQRYKDTKIRRYEDTKTTGQRVGVGVVVVESGWE